MRAIEELRRLMAEATPGPWALLGTPTGYTVVAPGWKNNEDDLKHRENTDLLRAAVSALPALLDVAEAAQRHLREKYPKEPGDECDLGPELCSMCELEEALARLEEGMQRLAEKEAGDA